jgi:hypothetical protein
MVRYYSKRILLPFVGVVQVCDLGWARALSLDGIKWSVRYHQHENRKTRKGFLNYDPRINIAIMLTIDNKRQLSRPIRSDLDPGQTEIDSQRFFEAILSEAIPYEAGDLYEYWLLDADDESPLALLHTCVDEDEMYTYLPALEWLTIPAAELAIEDPIDKDDSFYTPPINYRLQEYVATKAGIKPRAAWFRRHRGDESDFPLYLVRDKWEDPECQRLFELYLQRISPRMLMLGGIPDDMRDQLELHARHYALEVEHFHRLYPAVINKSELTSARVEARLRQANEEDQRERY